MTGTAETEAQEFWDIYKLDVMVIPTNRPVARGQRRHGWFKTKREKYNAAIEEVVKLRDAGALCWWAPPTWEVSELTARC